MTSGHFLCSVLWLMGGRNCNRRSDRGIYDDRILLFAMFCHPQAISTLCIRAITRRIPSSGSEKGNCRSCAALGRAPCRKKQGPLEPLLLGAQMVFRKAPNAVLPLFGEDRRAGIYRIFSAIWRRSPRLYLWDSLWGCLCLCRCRRRLVRLYAR